MYEIKHDSHVVKLNISATIIIRDEALMAHRYYFKVMDRSLKNILYYVDIENAYKPFGGKGLFLNRYFRHILPIIPKD